MAKKSIQLANPGSPTTPTHWVRATGVQNKYPLPQSISIWVKVSNLSDEKVLWSVTRSDSITRGLFVAVGEDGKIYLWIEGNSATHRLVSSNAITADGLWHHVLCVVTSMDDASIYLDGTKTTGDPTTSTSFSTQGNANARLTLGSSGASSEYWGHHGSIALPAWYGEALDDTEAATLLTEFPDHASLPTPGSYYDFESDSLNDLGAKASHLTAAGTVTFSTDMPAVGSAPPADVNRVDLVRASRIFVPHQFRSKLVGV